MLRPCRHVHTARHAVPDRRRVLRRGGPSCCARARWRRGGCRPSLRGTAFVVEAERARSSAGGSARATARAAQRDATPESGRAGDAGLVLVATPIGNLGDLVAARGRDAARRRRHRGRGHAPHPRAAHARRHPRGRPAARGARAQRAARAREWIVDAVRDGHARRVRDRRGHARASPIPASELVRACLDAGLAVDVVPGPSAVLTALVLSGLPDRPVRVRGLPAPPGPDAPRAHRRRSCSETRTTVLFEAPSRVHATLARPARRVRAAARGRRRPRAHQAARGGVARRRSPTRVGHVERTEPRGEHVIVLGPAPPLPEAGDDEIDAHVAHRARRGAVDARRRRARRRATSGFPVAAPTTPQCGSAATPSPAK